MRFLKADLDLRLLALISVMLISFVSFSLYYHTKINEMQTEYNEKLEHLKEIEKKLLLKEEELNEISELGEAIRKDKEAIEIGYLSLQGENHNLKKIRSEESQSAPFGKTLCKTTGNAQCFN